MYHKTFNFKAAGDKLMSYFQVWPCTPPQELYSTRSVHKPLLLPQTLTIPLIVHISY